MEAKDYLPKIAWRTWCRNVILLKEETEGAPAEYLITVEPIECDNLREPGSETAEKKVGCYLKSYLGYTYKVLEINYGGNAKVIRVLDDFRCGFGATSGEQGVFYSSIDDGESPYLAPIFYTHLDRQALDYSRQFELEILWRNGTRSLRIPFNNSANPGVSDYQNLYALKFGENPKVSIFVFYSDENCYRELLQTPRRFFNGLGLLTGITYDLDFNYSGYITLSR